MSFYFDVTKLHRSKNVTSKCYSKMLHRKTVLRMILLRSFVTAMLWFLGNFKPLKLTFHTVSAASHLWLLRVTQNVANRDCRTASLPVQLTIRRSTYCVNNTYRINNGASYL
jgi:hypothetical protein